LYSQRIRISAVQRITQLFSMAPRSGSDVIWFQPVHLLFTRANAPKQLTAHKSQNLSSRHLYDACFKVQNKSKRLLHYACDRSHIDMYLDGSVLDRFRNHQIQDRSSTGQPCPSSEYRPDGCWMYALSHALAYHGMHTF
jgi:hypothetical protein